MSLKALLGKIMADKGFVTKQQLDEAVQRQREMFHEKKLPERLQRARLVTEARLVIDSTPLLGQIMADMGFASEEQIEEAVKEQDKMAEDTSH